MKETIFTRHSNTVESIILVDNRKTTLQAIHTDAVNKAVNDQKKNIVLDDRPRPINDSEKDLTRNEPATLAQLRSGYCILLGSYKSRIKKLCDELTTYYRSNSLRANPDKTQFTSFHLKNREAKRTLKVKWDNTDLENTAHSKVPRCHLGQNPVLHEHIHNTEMKVDT